MEAKIQTKQNPQQYRYAWGNNGKRQILQNRICEIVSRGRMNSICVEFENGQKEIVSGNSIRKWRW